jgi:hypothetical protein
MRIILYLTLAVLIFFSVFSCSKGSIVKDPQFGSMSLTNLTTGSLTAVEGEDNKVAVIGKINLNLVSGKKRFRFYQNDTLMLDTNLSVEPYITHSYVAFRPYENIDLKVMDATLNGLDKEAMPDSGTVKISFANFSESLPNKVDIYLTTNTYTPNSLKEIQVGEFLNVSQSFSVFRNVALGKNVSGQPVSVFTVTIKDPISHSSLITNNLTLPITTTIDQQAAAVYILYLDAAGKAAILISK